MNFAVPPARRKPSSIFRIAGLVLAIALLMLTMADRSANAQTAKEVSSTAASSPGDWTQFLRDNMQRWDPYETVLGVNNVGKLQLKWTQTKINAFLCGSCSPIVANGVLYVGGGDDRLYAFNASTREALWTYTAGGSLISTPAVANGVVYFDTADGIVYALNASTGAKLWSHNTNSPSTNNDPTNDITVANGVVYAAMFDQNSEAGAIYAFNASTGALLWSTADQGLASTAAVAKGVVYFASTDHYGSGPLVALNANTGNVLWAYSGGPMWGAGPPVVANGVVYFSGLDNSDSSSNLYAVNASTGKTLWAYKLLCCRESAPAVADGVVYIASNTLQAVNAITGKQLWSYALATEVFSAPAVANGVVYISSGGGFPPTGNMYALNASTGAVLWSHSLEGAGYSPIVTNATIYVIDEDNQNPGDVIDHLSAFSVGADLFLRVQPSATTVHQGDLLTYTFPVWNLGPTNAVHEVLNTQVPAGTTFDYIRVSGTPGLATCTTPPYGGTGQIVCDENGTMGPDTTWAVRLTVKVTAPAGTVITEKAATMADTTDPNRANNSVAVNVRVQ